MSEEKTFPSEIRAAIMPPPGNNSNVVLELFMQILMVMSRVKALVNQYPQEVTDIFTANPLMARIFMRAELLLQRVGLPPYLPLETDDAIMDDDTDDISDDQAEATYSPQLLQPRLSPSPSSAPLLHFPPQVQPSSAPQAQPTFDGGNHLGEPSSPSEEEPPPPSQTPPNSTSGGDKK